MKLPYVASGFSRTLRLPFAVAPLAFVVMHAYAAAMKPLDMREGFVDVPGARLSYRDSGGNGIPVVFLHANTGSSRVWEHQEEAFAAAGFRLVTYDRRGFGRTTTEPGAAPATGADDLDALVRALRIDRFHLVGTAAGGFVAFDYALSFPDRLRSLVIANSIGGVQDERYVELGRRMRPAPFESMPAEFRELGPTYRAANPEGTRRWVELEHANRPSGGEAIVQPMRHRLTLELLETIKTPTLFLTGDADLYAPPPIQEMFAKRVQTSESVVVPGAGHSTYWEQPDVFNRAVLAFLAKH